MKQANKERVFIPRGYLVKHFNISRSDVVASRMQRMHNNQPSSPGGESSARGAYLIFKGEKGTLIRRGALI